VARSITQASVTSSSSDGTMKLKYLSIHSSASFVSASDCW
jgi:hypothetical protein